MLQKVAHVDVLCEQQFNFQLLFVAREQLLTTVEKKRIVLSVCEAQWQQFFTAEIIWLRTWLCHHQRHLMNATLHAVKVSKVKVRSHIQQHICWNLEAIRSKVGIAWWNAILVLSHEEQTVNFAVDRRRRVATVVLLVDLHDTTTVVHDVVEVFR